jgi:hypothetical protein
VVAEPTAEQKNIANQLGVIQVIERLFRAADAGSYPMRAHDDITAGMSFLAQFHNQLVKQLPEEVQAQLRKDQEASNGPKV